MALANSCRREVLPEAGEEVKRRYQLGRSDGLRPQRLFSLNPGISISSLSRDTGNPMVCISSLDPLDDHRLKPELIQMQDSMSLVEENDSLYCLPFEPEPAKIPTSYSSQRFTCSSLADVQSAFICGPSSCF